MQAERSIVEQYPSDLQPALLYERSFSPEQEHATETDQSRHDRLHPQKRDHGFDLEGDVTTVVHRYSMLRNLLRLLRHRSVEVLACACGIRDSPGHLFTGAETMKFYHRVIRAIFPCIPDRKPDSFNTLHTARYV
jgi:hypothetical protein